VFRHLDYTTLHYLEWIEQIPEGPKHDAIHIFNTMIYRIFNRVETMTYLGIVDSWNENAFCERIDSLIDLGDPIFGSAYMITNAGSTDPKHVLFSRSLTEVWAQLDDLTKAIVVGGTLEYAAHKIQKFPMYGPFVTYEVVTDLSYNILKNAPDINTWANLGPGAQRGMNRVEGQSLTRNSSNKKALAFMLELREWLNSRWSQGPILTLRDTEHSLCEFDKYCRVLLGEGRPKVKYPGLR
jgi:hypothetical protein